MSSKTVPQLMRRREAARTLGCSEEWLRRLERRGLLRPVRLGTRGIWYDTEDVTQLARRGIEGDRPSSGDR